MGVRSFLVLCAFGAAVTLEAAPAMAASSDVAARAEVFQRPAYQGFSWFSNQQTAEAARLARAAYVPRMDGIIWGDGSWACSPAGFGSMSVCIGR